MVLTLSIAEDRETLRQLRDAAAEVAQRRRDGRRAFEGESAALQALETQVAATRERAAAATRDLEAMRAVLAEVQTQELRVKALQEQSAQLDAQIAAATRDSDSKSAALLPQLNVLQERVKALVALEAQLAALLAPPPPMPATATPTTPAGEAAGK